MADFQDSDTVRIALDHPAGGQGHRIPHLGVTLTGEGAEYSGEKAQEILDFLPHTFVGTGDVTVTVLEQASSADNLADVLGESTAENVRTETSAETLSEVQALGDDVLLSVTGVGPATLDKLRSADSGDGGGGS